MTGKVGVTLTALNISADHSCVHIERSHNVSLAGLDVGPRDIVEDLYLRCFSRRPTDVEWVAMEPVLSGEPDAVRVQLEDLFWALLNAKEFIFTH